METQHPTPAVPAERHIDVLLSQVTQWFRGACEDCDQAIRERPRQSIMLAAVAGAMTRHLPISSLMAAGCRVAWSAIPPTLAVIGALKVADRLRRLDDEARLPLRQDDDRQGDDHLIFMPDSSDSSSAPAPAGKVVA